MNENEIESGVDPKEIGSDNPATIPESGVAASPAPEGDDEAEGASAPEGGKEEGDAAIYERQAEEDLLELQKIAPDAASYRHLGEMPGALRFAELRELGLSVEEAYCAVRGRIDDIPARNRAGRAHLHGSVPGRAAASGNGMTAGEIEAARRLFPGLPDREIAALWRRVNEN